MRINRRLRQGGAVFPNGGENIAAVNQADVFCRKRAFQLALGRQRQHIGRHAHAGVFRQAFGQIFHMGFAETELLQGDAAALKLLRGLFPIAAVRPQIGAVFFHHQRADRAGKAGNIHPRLPVLRQVFRQMRVGRGDNPRIERLRVHGLAQGGQTLGRRIHT